MNSLQWSKKYEVLGISKLYLNSIGLTFEQVRSLTDEDMQFIADALNGFYTISYDMFVKIVVTLFLSERNV